MYLKSRGIVFPIVRFNDRMAALRAFSQAGEYEKGLSFNTFNGCAEYFGACTRTLIVLRS
jgi:hypothetical protein